jgi:hypothetical protein
MGAARTSGLGAALEVGESLDWKPRGVLVEGDDMMEEVFDMMGDVGVDGDLVNG